MRQQVYKLYERSKENSSGDIPVSSKGMNSVILGTVLKDIYSPEIANCMNGYI